MGLYSDIVEEQMERHDPWSVLHVNIGAPLPDRGRRVAAQDFLCPTCPRSFATRDALGKHLYEMHRSERFYLRVNGRPALDLMLLEEPLRSAKVIPLGLNTVDVRVSANDDLIGRFSAVAGLETELVPDPVDRGLVTIDLHSVGRKHSYEIYVLTTPTMDPTPLDAAVRAAQQPLIGGGDPDWRGLLRQAQALAPSSLERRYMEGFSEYLLAAALDRAGDHRSAGRALERAWGRLIPFATNLARSAIAVIAFRLDAYGFLINVADDSSLAPIAAFLMSPTLTMPMVSSSNQESGIWIDDYQEALLATTRFAIRGQNGEALSRLGEAPVSLRPAAGNERKTLILTARLSAAENDVQAAAKAYSALRTDPVYGSEAEDWLR